MALVAGRVRGLEQCLQALCPLARKRRVAGVARSVEQGCGCRVVDAGQHGGARACLRGRGKKDEGDQALGRSRGGFSSKLHAASDALGNPLRFDLSAGQAGDAPRALALIDGIKTKAILADRAYDSDAILKAIREQKAQAVIPPHPVRSVQRETDWALYKERHKIEVMFGYLKHFRRVFARFDKLAKRYLAFVHFAAACVLLR